MRSAEVENFSFGMFNNETKTVEKIRKNIITAEKMRVGNMERFVLTYEKTIIDKQKNRNRNIENFKPIF